MKAHLGVDVTDSDGSAGGGGGSSNSNHNHHSRHNNNSSSSSSSSSSSNNSNNNNNVPGDCIFARLLAKLNKEGGLPTHSSNPLTHNTINTTTNTPLTPSHTHSNHLIHSLTPLPLILSILPSFLPSLLTYLLTYLLTHIGLLSLWEIWRFLSDHSIIYTTAIQEDTRLKLSKGQGGLLKRKGVKRPKQIFPPRVDIDIGVLREFLLLPVVQGGLVVVVGLDQTANQSYH